MKILVVTDRYFPSVASGGIVTVIKGIYEGLARRGYDVRVVTTDLIDADETLEGTNPVERQINGVDVRYFHTYKSSFAWKYKIAHTPTLFPYLKNMSWTPDVIHVHGYRHIQAYMASRAENLEEIPFILSPHGSVPYDIGRPFLKRLFDRTFGHPLRNRVDSWHALTEREARDIYRLGTGKPVHVIPNGVDVPVRDAIADKVETNKLLFLGRVAPRKRVDRILETVFHLQGDSLQLDVVGPNEGALSELQKEARNLHIDEQINWRGFVSEDVKIELLKERPIFCLLSDGEGMSISVLEAMAHGCPTILTTAAAPKDIKDAQAACVIPPDPQRAAKLVSGWRQHPERAQTQGDAGRSFIEQKYSVESMLDQYEEFYKISIRGELH